MYSVYYTIKREYCEFKTSIKSIAGSLNTLSTGSNGAVEMKKNKLFAKQTVQSTIAQPTIAQPTIAQPTIAQPIVA